MNAGQSSLALIDEFLQPGRWPVLLVAPLVLLAIVVARRRGQQRLVAAVGGRAARVASERRGSRHTSPLASGLLALGLFLGGVALLGPVGGEVKGEAPRGDAMRGADIVLCLDVSRSMRARDVAPDRLSFAAREIEAFVAQPTGHRLALVVYAGEARLAAPLTRDGDAVATLASLADPTDVSRGGTDLAGALDVALDALAGVRGDGARPTATVILIGDGGSSASDPARVAAARAKDLEAAARCTAAGVVVHALAVGTTEGGKLPVPTPQGEVWQRDRSGAEVVVPLDAAPLAAVSRATGGVLRRAHVSPGALSALVSEAVAPLVQRAVAAEVRLRRAPRWPPVVGLALFCLLLHVALGAAGRLARPAGRVAPWVVLCAATLGLAACGGHGVRDEMARALADLDAGRWTQAEAAADRIAARAVLDGEGDGEGGASSGASFAASVRGHVAWARSLALEDEAGPTAGPGTLVLEFALAQAEDATAAWRDAVVRGWGRRDVRGDIRNVERAMRRVEALRARLLRNPPPPPPDPRDSTPPPPDTPPGTTPLPPPVRTPDGAPSVPDVPPDVAADELPPEAVLGLLDALARKEAEKRATRRAMAPPLPAGDEDW